MSDTHENWKPEDETPGGWTYVDEDGETVFVPDDDCEHPDEEGGE